MSKHFISYLVTVLLVVTCGLCAAQAQDEESMEGFSFGPTSKRTSALPTKRSRQSLAITAGQEEQSANADPFVGSQDHGVMALSDGTCARVTVLDHGHTPVTIDAQGTLFNMKNNVVERVRVPC